MAAAPVCPCLRLEDVCNAHRIQPSLRPSAFVRGTNLRPYHPVPSVHREESCSPARDQFALLYDFNAACRSSHCQRLPGATASQRRPSPEAHLALPGRINCVPHVISSQFCRICAYKTGRALVNSVKCCRSRATSGFLRVRQPLAYAAGAYHGQTSVALVTSRDSDARLRYLETRIASHFLFFFTFWVSY